MKQKQLCNLDIKNLGITLKYLRTGFIKKIKLCSAAVANMTLPSCGCNDSPKLKVLKRFRDGSGHTTSTVYLITDLNVDCIGS